MFDTQSLQHPASSLTTVRPQRCDHRCRIQRHIQAQLKCLKWVANGTFLKKKHHLLRALLVVTAVIMIWRGMWNLLDFYLLPENPSVSSVLTILIGVGLLFIDDFRLDELR